MTFVFPGTTDSVNSEVARQHTREMLERMDYVAAKCGGLMGSTLRSCEEKYAERFYQWKRFYEWLDRASPWLIALGVAVAALVTAYWYRRTIEDAFVNAVAGSIRRKRQFFAHMSDVKERIREKASK